MNDTTQASTEPQAPKSQQPWDKPSEPKIESIQPVGKISHKTYVFLKILIILIAAPIIFFGSILTLMSPMTGDSGDTASALFAMFIIPVVGIILPLLITAKLLKKVRSLYDPRPDKNEYSSDVERTAMKLSKTVLIIFALVLGPFAIWILIELFMLLRF